MAELDSGLVYLFVLALWSFACLGLGWAASELWHRWRNRLVLRTPRELSEEELREIGRLLDT